MFKWVCQVHSLEFEKEVRTGVNNLVRLGTRMVYVTTQSDEIIKEEEVSLDKGQDQGVASGTFHN